MDIEELIKEQWQNAETTPPEEVWDRLHQRMQQEGLGTQSRVPAKGRWSRWMIAAASVAVAGAGLFVAVRLAHRHASESLAPTGEDAVWVAETQTVPAATVATTPSNDAPETVPMVGGSTAVAGGNEERQGGYVDKDAFLGADNDAVLSETGTRQQRIDNEVKETNPGRDNRPVASDSTKRRTDNATAVRDGIREQRTETQNHPMVREEVQTQQSSQENEREQRAAIDRMLQIPNLITPNHDGYNDCWVLKSLESLGTVQVQIFTAQSRRVFSSSNYHNDFCGDDLPSGNYFYVIVIKEKNYSRRGVLVIQR